MPGWEPLGPGPVAMLPAETAAVSASMEKDATYDQTYLCKYIYKYK